MNGLKTRVLQDLSHVVPTKSFQLPASRLHASPSNRRFWSLFEFSSKEETCQDAKKIPVTQNIVSSTLVSSNDLEDISRTEVSLPRNITRPSTMLSTNIQTCSYTFDPTTVLRSSLKIDGPFTRQDDLTSLLDGNPVPRNLKLKLKGYKTLRHEEAGDFAFVPGGNSYDFDILPRGRYSEWLNATTNSVAPARGHLDCASTEEALSRPDDSSRNTKIVIAKGQTKGTTSSSLIPLKKHGTNIESPSMSTINGESNDVKVKASKPVNRTNVEDIETQLKSSKDPLKKVEKEELKHDVRWKNGSSVSELETRPKIDREKLEFDTSGEKAQSEIQSERDSFKENNKHFDSNLPDTKYPKVKAILDSKSKDSSEFRWTTSSPCAATLSRSSKNESPNFSVVTDTKKIDEMTLHTKEIKRDSQHASREQTEKYSVSSTEVASGMKHQESTGIHSPPLKSFAAISASESYSIEQQTDMEDSVLKSRAKDTEALKSVENCQKYSNNTSDIKSVGNNSSTYFAPLSRTRPVTFSLKRSQAILPYHQEDSSISQEQNPPTKLGTHKSSSKRVENLASKNPKCVEDPTSEADLDSNVSDLTNSKLSENICQESTFTRTAQNSSSKSIGNLSAKKENSLENSDCETALTSNSSDSGKAKSIWNSKLLGNLFQNPASNSTAQNTSKLASKVTSKNPNSSENPTSETTLKTNSPDSGNASTKSTWNSKLLGTLFKSQASNSTAQNPSTKLPSNSTSKNPNSFENSNPETALKSNSPESENTTAKSTWNSKLLGNLFQNTAPNSTGQNPSFKQTSKNPNSSENPPGEMTLNSNLPGARNPTVKVATNSKSLENPEIQRETDSCAEKLARSPQSPFTEQSGGSFGFDRSSMSGGSGNRGNRGKPSFFHSISSRDTSSSNYDGVRSRSGKLSVKNAPRGSAIKSNNPVSCISTNAKQRAPRRSCKDNDETLEGREICTKPRENKYTQSRETTCKRRNECRRPEKRKQKKRKPCKRYCCPELTGPTECTYERKCPERGKKRQKSRNTERECRRDTCKERRRQRSCSEREQSCGNRQQRDPTCLPEEKPNTQRRQTSCKRRECQRDTNAREICTDPSRRRDCNRERSCKRSERRDRSCNRGRQDCQRNRNSREQSCRRERRRDCSRDNREGREMCTKPRRQTSCDRQEGRCKDRGCRRRSKGCGGRRSYSQTSSSSLRPTNSGVNVRRFSSLPSFGISLLTLTVCENGLKKRFYGSADESKCRRQKDSDAPSCKSTDDKSRKKCKKGPARCISKEMSSSSCGKTESQSKCSKDSMKKSSCYEDMCKSRKTSSERCTDKKEMRMKERERSKEESVKERASREQKEIRECKEDMKEKKGKQEKRKSNEKEASKPTGLERVISPCKQRQLRKDSKKDGTKCPPKKYAYMPALGMPLNYLASSNETLLFTSQENKPFNVSSTCSYSTVEDNNLKESSLEAMTDFPKEYLKSTNDVDLDVELLPVPLVIENQEEESEDTSGWMNTWFSSWFERKQQTKA